jgi:hypothetical protein
MKQNISGFCRLAGLLVLTLAALIGPTKTCAGGIFYQFNTPFPNDPGADGGPSWVSAYFQNGASPGEVVLSITNTATGGDFIAGEGNGAAAGGIFFNLIPSLNVSNLVFTVVSGNSYAPSVSLSQASDGPGGGNNNGYGFKADGDGFYSIAVDFGNNLTSGASVQFDITGISTLTAVNFESVSIPGGGAGQYNAAAHVQGLGVGGSTWIYPSGGSQMIPIPEPASSSLLVAGLGLLGAARLWLRRV